MGKSSHTVSYWLRVDCVADALAAYARSIQEEDPLNFGHRYPFQPHGQPMMFTTGFPPSSSTLYPPAPLDGQPGLMQPSPGPPVALTGTPKQSKAVPNSNQAQASGSTPGPSAATPAATPTSVTMTPVPASATLKRKATTAAEAVSPTTSNQDPQKRTGRKRTRTQNP